jgi:Domain of unknown function (DUF6362)
MNNTTWTASLVEEWLVEAADVLKRLPAVRVQGYYSLWPQIAYDFADLVGQAPSPLKRPIPSPAAISRMEETLGWMVWLQPVDAKIVLLRAAGKRWKTICWTVGLQRAAAHQHWLYALCIIALRLNGRRLSRFASKRRVIAATRTANG